MVEQYNSSRALPTCSEIRGHIHPGALLVNRACELLATDNEREVIAEPVEHGWEEHFGKLLPSECMTTLPQNVVAIGRCAGKYDTQRCGCRSVGVTCVIFCNGKSDNSSCKNLPRKDKLQRTHVMENCNEFDLLCLFFRVLLAFFRRLLCTFTRRCKLSLNDNLIVLSKPDIDLDT